MFYYYSMQSLLKSAPIQYKLQEVCYVLIIITTQEIKIYITADDLPKMLSYWPSKV